MNDYKFIKGMIALTFHNCYIETSGITNLKEIEVRGYINNKMQSVCIQKPKEYLDEIEKNKDVEKVFNLIFSLKNIWLEIKRSGK